MNKIHQYLDNQGEFVKKAIDIFLTNELADILNYAFKLEDIEIYLEKKKTELRNKILLLFKEKRKYVFAETDEDFLLTEIFFKYNFDFTGDLAKFKRHLKVATVQELILYEDYLFNQNLLLEKNREH